MPEPIPALDALPESVYVQKGNYHGVSELFINASAQGALRRNLGVGVVPGARVGVYRLDRIVEIKVGIQEIAQGEPPTPSPPPEPVTT